MTADRILTDVLTEQADGRPDPDQVLAGVHQRLQHRRGVRLGAVAPLVSAAAVAAVAVGAVVVTGRDGGPDRMQSARAGASSAPVRAATSSAPAKTASSASATPVEHRVPSKYPYSTIAAGWLPGPARQNEADNNGTFEERDYTARVDGVDMDVIIWTEKGVPLPTRMQAGGGAADREIRINGHPGREFIADNCTIVAFDLGNGTIAFAGPSVYARTATVTTARITDIAEQVARGMQFDRHDRIPAGKSGHILTTVRSPH